VVDELERKKGLIWSQEIPSRNPHFTGREKELATLRDSLMRSAVQVLSHPVQTVLGLGGVGKTEIAAEYAHRHAGEYDIVWWVRSDGEDRVRDALVRLGNRMELFDPEGERDRSIWAVIDALRTTQDTRWLLIFDNAERPDVVKQYLPGGNPRGHVIITSRFQYWRSVTGADGIPVAQFQPAETIAFLRKRVPNLAVLDEDLLSGDPAARREDDRRGKDAARLADALGNLPIAAEHAAAYLAETEGSVDSYLRLFEENAHELLSEDVDVRYLRPVATTWSVSRDALPADARELFQLCAFFSPEPIAEELFLRCKDAQLPERLRSVLTDSRHLGAAARRLRRFSLLQIDGGRGVYQMHRVVQAVTRDRLRLEEPEAVREYRAAVHILLAASNPGNPDRASNDVQYERSFQHLEPAGAIDTDNAGLRDLIVHQVRRLHLRGGHVEGLRLGERALAAWRERLGRDDLQVLALAVEVGIALRLAERSDEARELNVDTLRRLTERYGAEHELTLICANSYGADLRAQGRYQEALEHDRGLLQPHERVFLPDHPRTLNLRNNIAADLRRVGDFAGALEYDEAICRERAAQFGPSDMSTLRTESSMAHDLRGCGRYEESLKVQREVVEEHRARGGRENVDFVTAQKNFGVALRKAGYYEEARREGEAALQRFRDYLGDRHRYTVRAAIDVINDRRLVNDLRAARELGVAIVERCRDGHPRDLPIAAMTLAIVLRLMNDPEAAKTMNDEGLAGLRDQLGADHPFTLAAATNLASDLAALGKVADARALGEATLEAGRRARGEAHPDTLATAANLSLDRRADRDERAAEELRAETLAHYECTLTLDHPEAQFAKRRSRINVDIEPF